jgi:ribonuclease HII
VSIEPNEIDRINILQATWEGMRRAALGLQPLPDAALIDGRPVKKYPLHQVALVKGDSLSYSIAAASIIAKVTRDRLMVAMAQQHPEYGFEIHKGYPTPAHLAALQQHGPCPHHRRSFRPVAQLLLDLA